VKSFYVGDVGVILELGLTQEDGAPYPINNSNVITFLLKKPSGSVVAKQGEYVTNGADGLAQYVTVDGDLDQVGAWKYQLYIERGSAKLHSDIFAFRVLQNLAEA
jgi:hypothetical protein